MNSFMKKIRRKRHCILDDHIVNIYCVDPSEVALAYEEAILSPDFRVRLSFVSDDNENTDLKDLNNKDYIVPYQGSHGMPSTVGFNVTSAEVVNDSHSSSVVSTSSYHVNYTLSICSDTGVREIVCRIVRRYSDFVDLHKTLKKTFASELYSVVFPSKQLLGNLSSETIFKRSRAFEVYLRRLYSFAVVKFSASFTEFFIGQKYTDIKQLFLEGKYRQVLTILEHIVLIMEKLYGSSHQLMEQIVCLLIVCHAMIGQSEVADCYATRALSCFRHDSSLLLPLVRSLVKIRKTLARDRSDLEMMFTQLKINHQGLDSLPDLEFELSRQFRLGTS